MPGRERVTYLAYTILCSHLEKVNSAVTFGKKGTLSFCWVGWAYAYGFGVISGEQAHSAAGMTWDR